MKQHQAFGDMVTQLQPFARWSAAETFDEKRLAFATPVSTLMSSGEAAQRREAQRVRLCESLRAKSEDLMAEKVAEKAALGQELKKLSAETSVTVERQAAEVVRQLREAERTDANALKKETQAIEALERVLARKRKILAEEQAEADAHDAEDRAREEKKQKLLESASADGGDAQTQLAAGKVRVATLQKKEVENLASLRATQQALVRDEADLAEVSKRLALFGDEGAGDKEAMRNREAEAEALEAQVAAGRARAKEGEKKVGELLKNLVSFLQDAAASPAEAAAADALLRRRFLPVSLSAGAPEPGEAVLEASRRLLEEHTGISIEL